MEGQIKVASVQFSCVDGDMEQNRENALKMARLVAQREKGVDLMMFHECCLEGGFPLEHIDERVTARNIEFWKSVAAQTGINILAGRLERRDGGLHNMATVFAPGGEVLADYSKIHLYNSERGTVVPGDHLSIFELNGMKVGLAICADFGFPELFRAYALKGCDVVAVTSSWAYPDDDLWEICNRARSAENGIYVVSVDRTGPTSRGQVKVGRSMCCDPDGFILANLVEKTDTYFVCTMHRAEVQKRHAAMKWLEWVRPELYPTL